MRTIIRLTLGFLFANIISLMCYTYVAYFNHRNEYSAHHINLPYIYVITPTYKRLTQKADLTRLSNTLMHVPKLMWVVIEDSKVRTQLVTSFLNKTAVSSVHLRVATSRARAFSMMKGMAQRNKGLEWLKKHREHHQHNGVVYFADDDNTYSLELFAQMRSVKWISVWPVGLLMPFYETPKVENGKVVGWISWAPKERKFALDMAGFAFNIKVLDKYPGLSFRPTVPGYQESKFITQFVSNFDELEPGAQNCTEVLVWHTKTCRKPALRESDSDKYPLEM